MRCAFRSTCAQAGYDGVVRYRNVAVFVMVGTSAFAAAAACGSFAASAPDSPDSPDAPDATEAGEDRSVPSEAAPDHESDAGARSFCETVDATFCWSFDTDPFLLDPRSRLVIDTDDSGVVELSDAAKSPPYALRVLGDNTGGAPGTTSRAGQTLYFDAAAPAVRCEADVKVVSGTQGGLTVLLTTGSYRSLSGILLTAGSQTVRLFLVNPEGPVTINTPVADVTVGEWWHLELAYAGQLVTATVTRGGERMSATSALDGGPSGHAWRADTTARWEVLYDNITCLY